LAGFTDIGRGGEAVFRVGRYMVSEDKCQSWRYPICVSANRFVSDICMVGYIGGIVPVTKLLRREEIK
jgi:hypothetical protein